MEQQIDETMVVANEATVKLKLATTISVGANATHVRGRIYNRDHHEAHPHPDWNRNPIGRKVIFKSIEEKDLSSWITAAQKRADEGISNILITERVSEKTFGQRPLWKCILAGKDIRNTRTEGADEGKVKDHNNPADRRLREKWLGHNTMCPVFVQLAAALPNRFPEMKDPKYDNHLIDIYYEAEKLSVTIYDKDDVTPVFQLTDINVVHMKLDKEENN